MLKFAEKAFLILFEILVNAMVVGLVLYFAIIVGVFIFEIFSPLVKTIMEVFK